MNSLLRRVTFVIAVLLLLNVSLFSTICVCDVNNTYQRDLLEKMYAFDRLWQSSINWSNDDEIVYPNVLKKSLFSQNENEVVFIDKQSDGLIDSPWPMQCHDLHHTAQSPYTTTDNLGTEKWRFRTIKDGSIESGAVIDSGGTIYFGSMGSDHKLYAIYPNGTKKWSYDGIGGLIWSTPAISEDGTIYVTSYDSHLHAVNPNGSIKWTFSSGYPISSSPAVGEDGTIYFGVMGPEYLGRIYAINANGTVRWYYDTDYWIVSDPAISDDGTIYIGSGDSYLYALYPNGTLYWRFKTGDSIKGHPSIADDGTIYIPSFDGYLYALYPNNGTMKWRVSTSFSAASAAIADDGTIYAATDRLRAFYPDGSLKWSCDIGGDVGHPSPAISKDGTIYLSAAKSLIAVNSNGTIKWQKQITEVHTRSSPCIDSNGTVYVGSTWEDDVTHLWYGYLHAFGSGEQKKITIEQPESGKLYFFGSDLGSTPLENTVILGYVTVKIHAYSENEIQSIDFSIDGSNQYTVTESPFEWKMNRRYGDKIFTKHTLAATAYYKGGCSWSESLDLWYFHLLKI